MYMDIRRHRVFFRTKSQSLLKEVEIKSSQFNPRLFKKLSVESDLIVIWVEVNLFENLWTIVVRLISLFNNPTDNNNTNLTILVV